MVEFLAEFRFHGYLLTKGIGISGFCLKLIFRKWVGISKAPGHAALHEV